MSLHIQRARPVDALQRVMTSFKHFEKKLDKLQDDVNFHGQTLHELRTMVTNLAGGSLHSPDGNFRRSQKRSAAIQYDDRVLFEEPLKMKRKMVSHSMPSKLKVKSFQSQKCARLSPSTSPYHHHKVDKYPSIPIGVVGKHSLRFRKAEAPRTANTLRTQKAQTKKKIKIAK